MGLWLQGPGGRGAGTGPLAGRAEIQRSQTLVPARWWVRLVPALALAPRGLKDSKVAELVLLLSRCSAVFHS